MDALRVLGSELRVGDTIKVWWSPLQDTIIGLKPYDGPLKEIFAPKGAILAYFLSNKSGMTVECGDYYNVIQRGLAVDPVIPNNAEVLQLLHEARHAIEHLRSAIRVPDFGPSAAEIGLEVIRKIDKLI